jgi:hypothetical protein
MVDANDALENLQQLTNVVPERIAPATYYNSAPNFNADVLREEEDAQYNLPQKQYVTKFKTLFTYERHSSTNAITGAAYKRDPGRWINNRWR